MLSVFLFSQEPKRQRKLEPVMKRPTGMNREVYALLYSDKNDAYVIKLYLSYHGDEALMLLLHTHPSPPPHTHTTHSSLTHSNSPSLIPTDTGCGYRQPKARLGRKHVRPWKWMSFTNPARQVSHDTVNHQERMMYVVFVYCKS